MSLIAVLLVLHLLFQFHPSILKPYFDLALGEAEGSIQFDSSPEK